MKFLETVVSANHNLLRNKVRTFLTILAIFVGSFTIVLNAAINKGVNNFIDDQTESLGGKDYIVIMPEGSADSMSGMMGNSDGPAEYNPNKIVSAFSDEDLETIKNIDGIDGDSLYSSRQLSLQYITSNKTDKKYVIGAGAMPPGEFNVATTAGNIPSQNTSEYEITLQPGYAKALGYDSDEDIIGETVTIVAKNELTQQETSYKAKVVGVQAKGVVLIDSAIISHALEDVIYNDIMKGYPKDLADRTYMIQARFDTSKYTEDEIKQKLKDNGFYGATVSDLMGAIRSFFDVIMVVFTIFGGIALLAAAIGIVNTLLMSVEERTREIGLDKALGMSSGRIFLSFSLEAIALGFWGSAFGVIVAMVIGGAVNYAVHQPGGFLEIFPTFQLFTFTPENVIPIVVAVMLIAFIAGTAPAWKAARKNPIDALRYE